MLTTSAQQKIFAKLLSNPTNARCADCNAKSPTWASIDFGVFVCLNCSGAHRALGPSVTRVRSTKLDTWQSEWVQLMELGNQLCNSYWLANLGITAYIKITANSGLDEIKRYVVDKYVKRKYAKNGDSDPVTNLKNFKAKRQANNDFNTFDFKNVKDQDRFKTVSGGGFDFQPFSLRKNSGSEDKIKKKETFDIFNFDETPKHQNKFINPLSTPSVNLYQNHNEPAHKNHGHGHSLDFYTVSHNSFPITFNQGHQHQHQHQHQNQHQNQHQQKAPSQLPSFNQLTNLFPNLNPQPQPQSNNINFGNVFNQPSNTSPNNPTHNITYTKTSASHSFDIFGTSSTSGSNSFGNFNTHQQQQQQQPQSQKNQPVNMNINMYANSINFNFAPHTETKTTEKKDPFGEIDEFNF